MKKPTLFATLQDTSPELWAKSYESLQHPLRAEITLCLLDLVDDADDMEDQSKEWFRAIDRGGLTHVNDMTYQVFLAMELRVRQNLRCGKSLNLADIRKELCEDEDVLFYWSMVSADWDEEESEALLAMIVNLWVTIRGFSYASAWMEQYKAANHKSVQKSKGVRKKLLS